MFFRNRQSNAQCVFACLVSLAIGQSALSEETRQPQLAMSDQFGRAHDLAQFRGDVVVLVFADRGGAEASRELGAKLHVEFHPTAAGQTPAIAAQAAPRPIPRWPNSIRTPDAKIVALAVIGDVPSSLHSMVRFRFRQVAPDGIIWLDLKDDVRKQFKVVPDVPNVAVVDKQGRVRYRTWGSLAPDKYRELADAIEILRREPLPPAVTNARQTPVAPPAAIRR